MDANAIITIISNVGFPIAVAIAMFWFVNRTLKDITTTLVDLQKTIAEHSKVIESLQTELKISRLAQSRVTGLAQRDYESKGEE